MVDFTTSHGDRPHRYERCIVPSKTKQQPPQWWLAMSERIAAGKAAAKQAAEQAAKQAAAEGTKRCNRCGQDLPLSEFRRYRRNGKTYLCGRCRKCQNDYMKKWMREKRKQKKLQIQTDAIVNRQK